MNGMGDTMVTDLLIGVPALLGSLCFLVAAVSMTLFIRNRLMLPPAPQALA